MRKALVIGSEGNIGAPLVRHLRAQRLRGARGGHPARLARPSYVMADINHPVDLLPAFDWGPDVVFLLSAMVSRVTCEQASSLAIATNLAGINNVLQLAKRAGAMVVFFSTSEVYGPRLRSDGRARLEPASRTTATACRSCSANSSSSTRCGRTDCAPSACGRS